MDFITIVHPLIHWWVTNCCNWLYLLDLCSRRSVTDCNVPVYCNSIDSAADSDTRGTVTMTMDIGSHKQRGRLSTKHFQPVSVQRDDSVWRWLDATWQIDGNWRLPLKMSPRPVPPTHYHRKPIERNRLSWIRSIHLFIELFLSELFLFSIFDTARKEKGVNGQAEWNSSGPSH